MFQDVRSEFDIIIEIWQAWIIDKPLIVSSITYFYFVLLFFCISLYTIFKRHTPIISPHKRGFCTGNVACFCPSSLRWNQVIKFSKIMKKFLVSEITNFSFYCLELFSFFFLLIYHFYDVILCGTNRFFFMDILKKSYTCIQLTKLIVIYLYILSFNRQLLWMC